MYHKYNKIRTMHFMEWDLSSYLQCSEKLGGGFHNRGVGMKQNMRISTWVLGLVGAAFRPFPRFLAFLHMGLGLCAGTLFSLHASAQNRFPEMRCTSVDVDVEFRIVLRPLEGPAGPIADTMFLLDPTVKPGRALKAWFKSRDGFLHSRDGAIIASFDIRNPGTQKGTARIAGQRLDSLVSVVLDIDYDYYEPVGTARKYSGQATYTKIDQTLLQQDFNCLLDTSGPISLTQ